MPAKKKATKSVKPTARRGAKGDDLSTLPPGSTQIASAGGLKPFDPKAFASMRKGLAQDKVYQQGAAQRASAAAARAKANQKPTGPKASPGKPTPLMDRITGMKTRRSM